MALPERERKEFLKSTQTGPQGFDGYGRDWMEEYNKTAKKKVNTYPAAVARAKQEARKR